MSTRPPTSEERGMWTLFRLRCMEAGSQDPGEAPDQWPADPEMARRVAAILRSIGPEFTSPQREELRSLLQYQEKSR